MPPGPSGSQRPGRAFAVIAASALSSQTGAAVGSYAFSTLTPVGVVAARQLAAATVLTILARPKPWAFTRTQWTPVLLMAVFFAGMNTSIYAAIDRLGLGTAVTIEFLGPLAVAVVATRRRRDWVCAALALLGVILLTRPGPSSDLLGLGFALTAAACWAGHILAARVLGRRLPGKQGVEGVAVATTISSAALLPIAVLIVIHMEPPAEAFLYAAGAGLLASALPYTLDLLVLRRVSPVVFGLGMSLNPLFAALIGALFLAQHLPVLGWVGIALVMAANALTLTGQPRLAVPPVPPDLRPR